MPDCRCTIFRFCCSRSVDHDLDHDAFHTMISSAVVPATTPDFSAVDGGDEFFCHIVAAIVLMQCCVCEQISPETLF